MTRVADSGDRWAAWRALRFAWVAVAVVLGALTIGAASAPAIILHVGHKRLSYQPVAASRGLASPFSSPKNTQGPKNSSNTPLEYYGGPVMTSNTNYPLYWAPGGAGEYPAGYQSGINKWFEDLAA